MIYTTENVEIATINSLPKDIFLDWSLWKEIADDKINVTEKFTFILGRLENIM